MGQTKAAILLSAGILGTIAAVGAGVSTTSADSVQVAEPESIVIHLTKSTDDLHAVSMALKLGTKLAEHGADVTMMLDLEGVRLVDSRISQDLSWGGSTTIDERWVTFVEAGGSAKVCPHCADVAGLKGDMMKSGAAIATEEGLAQLLLDADKILDY